MPKFFVLDTNILLDYPEAIFAFDDNVVILTETILEELNSFKKLNDDRGYNARIVIRYLEDLRKKNNLLMGASINDNGLLKIENNHIDIELPYNWNVTEADHRLLQVCSYYKEQNIRLITNDIILRIKADMLNIPVEEFKTSLAPKENLQYTGRCDAYVLDDDFDNFYHNGEINVNKLIIYDNNGIAKEYNQVLYPYEFILLKNSVGNTALGKINKNIKSIQKLQFTKFYPYGVTPKNTGQQFMVEALMNDVPLTIIKGPAGTAKTLLSLACGLERTIENEEFRRILICKSLVELGGKNQIGYLPGTEREKIDPYQRSIYDNLEILIDSNANERYKDENSLQNKINYLFDKEYIIFQAVSFLRGRSINKQYVIIDEAQNLSQSQMKAIVTRIGENTKLVILGDPMQIDSPFLNSRTNGLSWLSEKMKGSIYCNQLTMFTNECIRSKLAADAISRLG